MANLRFDLTSGKLVFSQAGGNKLAIFCDSLSCTNCSSATPMTVDVAISGATGRTSFCFIFIVASDEVFGLFVFVIDSEI